MDEQWITDAPKARAGTHTIKVPERAEELLHDQKALQAPARLQAGPKRVDYDLIFTGRWGQPLQQNVVQNTMTREREKLGLPRLRPHGLRHTNATILIGAGIHIPAVSARLGHANPATALGVYSHAVSRQDDDAAQTIGRALTRQPRSDESTSAS